MNGNPTALLCLSPLGRWPTALLAQGLSSPPACQRPMLPHVPFQKLRTQEASAPFSQRSGGREGDGEGVLPWANAGCPEDLGSVGGGQEEERGANFGSLTLPSALSGKSPWRWGESRLGPLWPRERGGRTREGFSSPTPFGWPLCAVYSCTCERVSRCGSPGLGPGAGSESMPAKGSRL